MSEASICAGASQIDLIPQDVPEWRKKWEKDFPIINGESAYYMNLNRNKKGITLNLKSEKGKDILRKLAAQSDILIENYRPSVMEKLGLGYEDMKEVNPGLIYGCVSGFGHYGPYSRRAGYDIIGQAMSGLMSTTGWPGGQLTRTGTAIADVLGGLSWCVQKWKDRSCSRTKDLTATTIV